MVVTYGDLFNYLNEASYVKVITRSSNAIEIFYNIILSLIYDIPIVLLDHDFSLHELEALGVSGDEIDSTVSIKNNIIINDNNIIDLICGAKRWTVTLFTSGTTGLPKKISHSFDSISRSVKIDFRKNKDVWGYAYNPTHIAGLQVFFQAILNLNSLINIFGKTKEEVYKVIEQYGITNISATPTFFRLLLPYNKILPSIKRITFGGEKFDNKLSQDLLEVFPHAKVLNIYASTEAGTVIASKGDRFEISEKNKDKVRILNDELLVHDSMLGDNSGIEMDEGWYHTGDLVKVVKRNPLTFEILQRSNEMINVGGYKVNPYEVEEILNSHDAVLASKVYSKKNSLLGNVVIADVVKTADILEKELRKYLKDKLQAFKLPRIINFVEKIEMTRTGKVKRS